MFYGVHIPTTYIYCSKNTFEPLMLSSFFFLALCSLISSPLLANAQKTIKITSSFPSFSPQVSPSLPSNLVSAPQTPIKRGQQFLPVGTSLNDACYLVNVTAGKGRYSLIVDSGSAYTWIGADPKNPYLPGQNSVATGQNVTVVYGSGNFTGFEFIDTITIGDDLVIRNQQFASAVNSFGFEGVDGILGIGPRDRTFGTTGPNPFTLIPTVSDQMLMQNIINKNITSIAFSPLTTPDFTINGQVTFGDVDSSEFTGKLTSVPTTHVPPASTFWGFEQSLSYGNSRISLMPAGTPGIADSGTTLILLPPDAFAKYQNLIGAVQDDVTGLLKLDSLENVQSLFFTIGGTEFEFIADAQIIPPQMNVLIGGDPKAFYSIVGNLGPFASRPDGPGVFVNGYFWMMRHFVSYDGTQKTLSVAQTQHTFDKVH